VPAAAAAAASSPSPAVLFVLLRRPLMMVLATTPVDTQYSQAATGATGKATVRSNLPVKWIVRSIAVAPHHHTTTA
jgi:hypothetical protein